MTIHPIVNGIAAAPFFWVTMMVASDRTIMGEYVTGKLAFTLGWLTAALMALSAFSLLIVG